MKGPNRGKKRVVGVDFSGIESRGRAIPDGVYFLTSIGVEEKESSEGNPYLAWEWRVADGDLKGAKVWDNTSLQPQALWRLKILLEMGGREPGERALELDLDALVGMEIRAEITNEEFQGKQKPRITNFLPYDGKTVKESHASSDGDDDEEDAKPAARTVKRNTGGLKVGKSVKFIDDNGKNHKGVITSIEDGTATVDVKGEEWEIAVDELTAA